MDKDIRYTTYIKTDGYLILFDKLLNEFAIGSVTGSDVLITGFGNAARAIEFAENRVNK